ncbi:MAG: hypothetical protein GY702_10940 [Desulfobulbaceae bacterium]|nr:hypothetical protein [Desulfobulbaceae bacterium]
MKLSAPKQIVFLISVVLAALGALSAFGIFSIGVPGSTLLLAGFIVLALGNVLTGL